MKAHRVIFFITLAISILLCVAGFIVPPTGVIDGSVLSAVGELFAFAALAQVTSLLRAGKDIKIKHHDTEVTIDDDVADEK